MSEFAESEQKEYQDLTYREVLEELSSVDAQASLDKLRTEDSVLYDQLLTFCELSVKQQLHLLRTLKERGLDSTVLLRQEAVVRKLNGLPAGLDRTLSAGIIDEEYRKIRRGYVVEFILKTPLDGSIQTQHIENLLQEIRKGTAQLIVFDPNHPELKNISSEGLLELHESDTDHPGIIRGQEAVRHLANSRAHRYGYTSVQGTVDKPSGSDGVITLTDQTKIQIQEILICNIVGADAELLRRQRKYYYGKNIRIWVAGAWRDASVTDAGGYANHMSVYCPEGFLESPEHYVLSHRGDFSKDGPFVNGKKNSPDTSFDAPPEQIHIGTCISYRDNNDELTYGIITFIDPTNHTFDAGRWGQLFDWDADVEYLNDQESTDDVRVQVGTRISVKNSRKDKSGGLDTLVYAVVGIDNERQQIVCQIVGPRDPKTSPMIILDACTLDDREDLMIYNNDAAADVFERFPVLREAINPTCKVVAEYRYNNEVHRAHIFTHIQLDTLPVHLGGRLGEYVHPNDIMRVYKIGSEETVDE